MTDFTTMFYLDKTIKSPSCKHEVQCCYELFCNQ